MASFVLIVHFNIVTSLPAGYVADKSTEVSLANVISHPAIVYSPNVHAVVILVLNSVSSSTILISVVLFKAN